MRRDARANGPHRRVQFVYRLYLDARQLNTALLVTWRGTRTHLDLLAGALLDPFLCGVPFLVEKEETALSTTLDELIGFCDKLGGVHPLGKLGVGRNGVCLWIPGDLGDFGGRINETRGNSSMLCDRWGTLEPVRKQELRVVLVDG